MHTTTKPHTWTTLKQQVLWNQNMMIMNATNRHVHACHFLQACKPSKHNTTAPYISVNIYHTAATTSATTAPAHTVTYAVLRHCLPLQMRAQAQVAAHAVLLTQCSGSGQLDSNSSTGASYRVPCTPPPCHVYQSPRSLN